MIVLKPIGKAELQSVSQEKLMIEGCKEMVGESLKVLKDWSATDCPFNKNNCAQKWYRCINR